MNEQISPDLGKKTGSNVPELSVSELAFNLKRTLEDSYGRIRVRGELSRVNFHTSGHVYSALKDDQATLDVVCWKTTVPKLKIRPEEGLEVICTGRITTYPARSNYQLVIEQMELAGVGAILKMIEDRRIKLAAEGLFDDHRKRTLPFLPTTIGVITSPTGAVIRDILHRLADRFPVNVILWPVRVQGETAADEVCAAIEGFNALPQNGSIPRPDVLIVARGGGSIEDLMPFNDEALVRAAAASSIPLISAVGHETDTTLIDYAADARAPTPTAAAEFAVPVRSELIATLEQQSARATTALNRHAREYAGTLQSLSARLGTPSRLLDLPIQRVDHLASKLSASLSRLTDRAQGSLNTCAARLIHPAQRLREMNRVLSLYNDSLSRLTPRLTDEHAKKIEHFGRLLESYSYHNVLKRGYAVVHEANGKLATNSTNLQSGDIVRITFADGILGAKINEKT